MDVDEFIKQYPFLHDMVIAYKEFNNTVNAGEMSAISLLTNNLKKNKGLFNEQHSDVYEKLIRNLLYLFINKYGSKSPEKCSLLYQWLYISQYKNNISDYPVTMVYKASENRFVGEGVTSICPYYSYDANYNEPINIIKLQNFYNNIDTIAEVLMNKSLPQEKDSHYCYALRYANECVKIYRNMHDKFCSSNRNLSTKNQKTCSDLETFNYIYTNILFKQGDIKEKIPDLSSSENEKLYGCPADEPTAHQELNQGSQSALGRGSVSGPEHGSVSVGVEQQNNSIKLNSTAVVGSMIGIPPFVGLIYKFTPVGTMFRPKNKKTTHVFSNIDEEIEKELYYPRLENATINTSPSRYNVAYGPV
ncbi:unnamed protein product [Plasmodium vivax]|uniref:(malaria parasite P. vivax) hypothetical protein n=1 Tax=Plasmodium vivax TaxID=5855 RepID=A0A8S4H4N1_PLAVI|nr:unnamed protein product [Plasmodium vivax]